MADKQLFFGDTSIAFANKSVKELRKTNFLFTLMGVPELTKVGTFFIKTLLRLNFPIKNIVKSVLFRQFCGGESLEECQDVINQLYKSNIKSIPDYSAEGESDEEGYEKTIKIILETISLATTQKSIGFTVFKFSGIGSSELLEKIQEKKSNLNAEEVLAFKKLKSRVHQICETAFLANVKILIDAEESWIQSVIDELVIEMMIKFNKEKPIVYNTYQMYKTASYSNLCDLKEYSVKENFIPAVKLVRGAYMEKERIRAEKEGYLSPIFPNKEATDNSYSEALRFCIDEKIAICAGSHNEGSNLLLTALMKENNISITDERIYFAQLYGMSDHISFNLAKAGYNVAKYLPFGPVKLVMPYLFRRAEENTSVLGQMGRELKLVRTEIKRRKISG